MDSGISKAEEVVIHLKKEFRVSRNIRLKWYLDHLNSPITVSANEETSSAPKGLEVISVFDKNGEPTEKQCMLTTDTRLSFVSSGYKFVFALDLSSSVLRVDTFQQCVMVEAVLLNLEECLMSLIQPFIVPGYAGMMQPTIYLTIFAQWNGTSSGSTNQKVIIQGCKLNSASIQHIIPLVKKAIYSINYTAEGLIHSENVRPQAHDNTIISIIETAILALQLLPPNTSSGLVVFTDGVIGEPVPIALGDILSKCQNLTTACSFVHVNPSSFPLCNFGCVSHTELMQFIAQSTKGKYINTFQIPSAKPNSLNNYQKLLLLWSFQVDQYFVECMQGTFSSPSLQGTCSVFELRNINPDHVQTPALLVRKHSEKNLRVALPTVVGSRLREGYCIKKVAFPKSTIEVHLVLCWWKNHTTVEYRVIAPWPLSKKSCKIEVYVAGTYEFLYDISRGQLVDRWTRSRKQVTQRFGMFIRNLQQADHMLQNLASFNHDPVYCTVSDVLAQAQSLFYLPPNSNQFVLSAQAENTPNAFSSYWKPVLSLDVSIWQKWLHIHYVHLLLKHDSPLPKHLHNPTSDGRYHPVQCQVAYTQLLALLREWCTFVLLEGHTYVKFIFEGGNKELPASFFLVRVWSKSAAVVLKVAFFIGVPGETRKYYVDDLREKAASMGTTSAATSVKRVRHSSSRVSPSIRSKHLSDKRVTVFLMSKPLDRLLVQQNQVPRDYLHIPQNFKFLPQQHNMIGENSKRIHDLQGYMIRKRYVWSVTSIKDTPISMEVAVGLPNLLMKLRMAEGYNIAHSAHGVLTLAREFPLASMFNVPGDDNDATHNCLVQCILFPPKIKMSDVSVSTTGSDIEEDEDVEENNSTTKEILLAMEIWTEPQYGIVSQPQYSSRFSSSSNGSSSSMKYSASEPLSGVPYYEGLQCHQIAPVVSQKDTAWISNVITLEQLQLMCKSDIISTSFPQVGDAWPNVAKDSPHDMSISNETLVSDDVSDKGSFSKVDSTEHESGNVPGFEINKHITAFPCMFNFIGLLDQSPRSKLLFMTLQQKFPNESGPNEALFCSMHQSIEKVCDCEVDLSTSDQRAITNLILSSESLHDDTAQDNNSNISKQWCCYLKAGDDGQVMIVILPATYSDFRNIFSVSFDAETQEHSTSSSAATLTDTQVFHENLPAKTFSAPNSPATHNDDKTVENGSLHRIARRISIKRQTSSGEPHRLEQREAEKSIAQRTFSVYVYNCSMNMVVSSALQSVSSQRNIKWQESVQDHRFYTYDHAMNDVMYQNLTPTKEYTDIVRMYSTSHSVDGTDEVFPLVSHENEQVNHACMQIVDAYRSGFVSGVFEGVQNETEQVVSTDDLQIVTDSICQEYVEEIDITDFMLLNSPQVAEFKNQHLTPFLLTDFNQLPDEADIELNDIEDMCKDGGVPKKPATSEAQTHALPIEHSTLTTETLPKETEEGIETNMKSSNVGGIVSGGVRILPQKESAFTSVRQRHRVSECEKHLPDSSSSEEENEFDNRKRKAQSHHRERKITHTLPVKQVDMKKNMSGSMQSGWKNLPMLSISILAKSHSRHLSGSVEQLEKYFNSVLKKYCRSVPQLPDVYYAVNHNSNELASATQTTFSHYDSDTDAVQFASKQSASDATDSMYDKAGSIHADDNASSSSAIETYMPPLFLCMTCTVRDKASSNHGTLSVNGLPTDLATVLDAFENPCQEVNLSDLKITLDLIWLFLPNHLDNGNIPKSDPSARLSYKEGDVNVSDFPSECLLCVAGVKKSISWLLEDEIMSSLRTCEPINQQTLEKVTKHIEQRKSSNCKMETVPLQYIFGLESSKPLFFAEFERFRFEKYKLKREENFYYVSVERGNASFLPIKFTTGVDEVINGTDVELIKDDLIPNHGMKTPQSTTTGQYWSTPITNTFPVISAKPDQVADTKHGRRSCVSLYQRDQDTATGNKLQKAASSVELSSCGFPAKRSSSVSNVLEEATVNPTKSGKLSQNKPVPLHINPSMSSGHQPLHASLSCGKEHFSPLFVPKGSTMSMPGTPANTESVYFNFGAATNKLGIDAASFPGPSNSRDPIFSPMSDTSPRHYSQTSLMTSGYEGEVSDTEEEDYYLQLLQEGNSQLPNFWLIVQINDDCANLYFHRRGSARVMRAMKMEQNSVIHRIISNLHNACRAVNQTLLLKKLHESHMCHSLLVEEPAEDIWKREDYSSSSVYQATSIDDYNLADETLNQGEYLAANMNFRPGYFECQCVLQQSIALHHRIAGTVTGSALASTAPTAMSTVKSFLKNFAVVNQKHMFVFQMEDGTIFYCRMNTEIRKSEPNSRRSSLVTPSSGLEQIPQSVRESKESLLSVSDSDPKLCITWYGVHDLTCQHLSELTKVKQSVERKLDDAVLEYITLMLTRNKMFKLTPADVSLIQPRVEGLQSTIVPKDPDDTLTFHVSGALVNSLTNARFLYYLHQNILQFVITPRYAEPNNTAGFFLPYRTVQQDDIPMDRSGNKVPGSIYVYNGSSEKGRTGQGLACVFLDLTTCKSSDNLINSDMQCSSDVFKSKCQVVQCMEGCETVDSNQAIVQFYVWTRGIVKLDILGQKLSSAIHSTLCDLILEYLLMAPMLQTTTQKTDAMRSLSFPSSSETTQSNMFSMFQTKVAPKPSKPTVVETVSKHLSEKYYTIVPEWLSYMITQACPSVSALTLKVNSRSVNSNCTRNLAQILENSLLDSDEVFLFEKSAVESVWKVETGSNSHDDTPGHYPEMLVISKNLHLWKKSIGGPCEMPRPNLSTMQKFVAHDVSHKPDLSPCPQHSLISSSSFICRQHFAYVSSKSLTSITVYLYNITAEKTTSFHKKMQHCVAFHNARHSMMQGNTLQKLGLFKHRTKNSDISNYTVDILTRHTTLPPPEKLKQKPTYADRYFDEHYLDCHPHIELRESDDFMKDKVSHVGHQCISLAKQKYKRSEEKMHLKNLFAKFHKVRSSSFVVSSTTLSILMSHAKLIFTQSTPIVLSCMAQKKFLTIYSRHKRKTRTTSGSKAEKLTRRSSFLESYRRKSGDSLTKATGDNEEEHGQPGYNEDQLASCFYQFYFEHCKGFVQLQVDTSRVAKSLSTNPHTEYMYRAMAGGMVLLTLTFHDDLFDVKLYGIDLSHISTESYRANKSKLNLNFLNNCERFKEFISVHTIGLDLQLKEVQLFISEKRCALLPGCSLSGILQALVDCYEPVVHPLSHHILRGNVTIPCPNVSHKELFGFITSHSHALGLEIFSSNCSLLGNQQVMLCCTTSFSDEHISDCCAQSHQRKNICILFTTSASSNTRALVMEYYILFTDKPIQQAISPKAPTSKSKHPRRFSEVGDFGIAQSLAMLQREKLDLSSVIFNRLDTGESHQASCFVKCEQTRTEKCLAEIGTSAETECYRHQLWSRLGQMCREKSSTSPLSTEEFNKLVNLMHATPASELDDRALKLVNTKNTVKYGSRLQKRLLRVFAKSSASFISGDNNVQTVCVINHEGLHCMVAVHVNMEKKSVSIQMVQSVGTPDMPEDLTYFVSRKLLKEVLNELYLDFWSLWW